MTPNGNPTGPSSAESPLYWLSYYYTVSLSPGQAVTPQAWPVNLTLSDVLGAQGFTAANGWTINRFNLQGNMTLNTYLAFAEAKPAYNSPDGSLIFPGGAVPGAGGAELGLTYNPQGTDPSGFGVHWIQIVATNDPIPNPNGSVQAGNGTTYYVDDAAVDNPTMDGPWYDQPDTFANSTNFFDAPRRHTPIVLPGSVWYS